MIADLRKIRTCVNNCIFCFINQLPGNLRETLYIRDDDYLESYTNGNFITLTNISQKDIKKIIRYRIEPLHISVHSFNADIRKIIFGNDRSNIAIDRLYELDKNGIRTNIQIVLCPGINDSLDIENTLLKLISDFKNVLSIGIVPVGITRYNKNPILISFNRKSGAALIDFINDFRTKNLKNKLSKKIYLSDEFYLIAGREFPGYSYYGKFLQLQNGIGKAADFISDFRKEALKKNNPDNLMDNGKSAIQDLSKTLIITSEYGELVLKKLFSCFADIAGLLNERYLPQIITVKNSFFGGNVKVTGLLAGRDIIEKISLIDLQKYERILIPAVIFNKQGLTLDDLKIVDFKNISPAIMPVDDNGKSFYNALRNKV